MIFICAWLFVPLFLPFIWIVFGTLAVLSFFYYSSVLSVRWAELPNKKFEKNIFNNSLIIRVIYIILIYYFYQFKTGIPFEFTAADSTGYHVEATWIVKWFVTGHFWDFYINQYVKAISDTGWPLIIAFFYLFSFNSIILIRLLNSIVSAWTVVLIYRIAQRNFGESVARIAAIMSMLLPAFVFYSGLHLKETLMVFLLMAFIDRADILLHSRSFKLSKILVLAALGTSLFFFRTVLGVAAWFAFLSAFFLSSDKLMSQYRRIILISWLIIAMVTVFSGSIYNDIIGTYNERNSLQKGHLEFFSTREGANKFAKYGRASIFIPIILLAPFPTFVNVPMQEDIMMVNGDLFTRNVYVFFVLVAFITLYKKKRLRKNLLLSVFLLTYLLVLANSGFALSSRFHVPALPFLILFASYGITQTNRNYTSYYILYLILISVIIIGWNWFKLAGRGLI